MSITKLRRHLVDTVTVEPFTGTDGFGEPSYGAPVQYPAKIEGSSRVFPTAEGRAAESKRKIFIDTGQGPAAVIIGPQDRITLPSQFWPSSFGPAKVLEVKIVSSPKGVDHLVVYV